jgi:asparagine synthase (glutamine-hydrolysing)
VIDFDVIDVLGLLKKAIYAQGGPLSHPHALAVFALAQETTNKGKVLITGEGADELLYGYNHYKNNNSTFAFLEHINPVDYFDINSEDKNNSLQDLSWNKYLENNDFRDLDIKTHLLSLLRRNDRVSMQNSVEVRSAFLDFQLFQYVVWQQENGSLVKGKDALLEIVQGDYKDYKVDENKIGFYVPFDDWFEAESNKNILVKNYIENAKAFFELNFTWTLKKSVHVKDKLAWILLNIGLFLELEGDIK